MPDQYQADINHPAWALAVKRLFDIAFSLLMISATWPVIIAAVIAVKASSPGPVFYRGLRSGLNGKTFRILKFRTMVENAEALGGPTTGTNDPRVTRVGSFLRRTKLDEFPQFFNVLIGDMSLVGPRPEVLQYTSAYKGEEKLILAMRPGITDYASVEFADLDNLVGQDDPDEFFREHILPRKNALRVRYVREWSLSSDFTILGATFIRVAKKVFSV